ncbi:MAG: DNA polymerase III subunit delta [Tissierellia bacterium]|nr:DNA polymerase III subunit delta [Tissierellia bacterium]
MNYREIYKTKNFKKTYLFYGAEKLLIENTLDYLIHLLINKGTESFNVNILQGKEASVADLMSACETVPIMGDKKIVWLKNVAAFVDQQNLNSNFFDFLDHLPEFILLIFEETENLNKNTKFYRYFSKNKINMEFAPLTHRELQKFVQSSFARKNKKIKPVDMSYFISQSNYLSRNSEVTLYDIKNEIDKISSVTTEEWINRKDIIGSLSENIDTNIFQFLDALFEGNPDLALREFHNLYKLNEPIPKIFVMIHRQVRLLLGYKVLEEANYQSYEMMERLKIKKFEFSKIQKYAPQFDKDFLIQFYDRLLEADKSFKSSNSNPLYEMEKLILIYCRRENNTRSK